MRRVMFGMAVLVCVGAGLTAALAQQGGVGGAVSGAKKAVGDAAKKAVGAPTTPTATPKTTAPAPTAAPAGAPRSAIPASPVSGPANPNYEADEKTIRAVAEAFAKAYNAHDEKALGALFAADAEVISEEGAVTKGRDNIEQLFGAMFDNSPTAQMTVNVQSVRFLTPAVAIEDGSTTTVHSPDESPERSRYTVVHLKQQDGKWLMSSARDLSEEPNEDELNQLEWMVGEWIDESPDAVVHSTTRWADNHHFLLNEFSVQVGGNPVMQGTQRIGWDPLAKVIRSWVFDSEGGFSEGFYARAGNEWIVKMKGVTNDGELATATNITTRLSNDRMTWQSRDRTVGGVPSDDIDEVVVVRKPPKPKEGS